jgi:hypothetical protein
MANAATVGTPNRATRSTKSILETIDAQGDNRQNRPSNGYQGNSISNFRPIAFVSYQVGAIHFPVFPGNDPA